MQSLRGSCPGRLARIGPGRASKLHDGPAHSLAETCLDAIGSHGIPQLQPAAKGPWWKKVTYPCDRPRPPHRVSRALRARNPGRVQKESGKSRARRARETLCGAGPIARVGHFFRFRSPCGNQFVICFGRFWSLFCQSPFASPFCGTMRFSSPSILLRNEM